MEDMNIEIEIKARIREEEKEVLLETLHSQYRFVKEYCKKDIYFQNTAIDPPKRVRVRNENGTGIVTFKEKTKDNGMEINREWETVVENEAAAKALLEYLGCSFHYEKTKTGNAFCHNNVTIELSKVNDLGWFLELEYLASNTKDETLKMGESAVRGILHELGIPDSAIEDRFYSELILTSG